ncbi:UNVERIFIED_CONTAM: hypothetical protein HDU68_008361 [Siphonaria sp. JEL0065]|nr:hypothetical protein HDU68_008361 [Siphonaria sp. JEL0065]
MSSPETDQKPEPQLPTGLVLGSGFKQFTHQAAWIGLSPSQEIVLLFKTAHLTVLKDSPTVAAQQTVFDVPTVWGIKASSKQSKAAKAAQKAKGVTASVSPIAWFFANATRWAVCALEVAEIETIREFALALKTLPFEVVVANGSINAPVALPEIKSIEHKKALASLLQFLLNAPQVADVFLYSTISKECIILQNTLNTDSEKLKTAGRIIIQKPTPQQQSTSLTVCFWCGASPLSKDVTLHKCEQCECVAYCSEICQASDWEAEHHRECSRTEKGVHETAVFGLPSLPASSLSITRIETEKSKVQRGTVQVIEGGEKTLDVTVTMCFSRVEGATVLVPMGWEVEA